MIPKPKKRRICIFPETLNDGGIGRYTINLAEALLHQGTLVDIFLTRPVDASIRQPPQQARVFVGSGSTKTSLGKLYTYLRQEKPDALITARTYVNFSSIVVKKLAGVSSKVIITLHTPSSLDDQDGKSHLKKLYAQLACWLYPHADTIVAVSDAVAEDSARHFKLAKERIKVIYNPIVTPSLYSKSQEAFAHPFFPKGAPVILGLGRLVNVKDFATLIRAFGELRKTMSAKLLILGEGEERGRLEALVHELKLEADVSLPGFVSNPYPYIKAADILVSSSKFEGLPTVIVEALALGTPVVATDCPGGSREILQNGDYGQLVSTQNPTALAKAVMSTLTAVPDKAKLKERGQVFSMEASAQRYLELL
jgi:glycosyltransferase involved in cell wall biosynthesis